MGIYIAGIAGGTGSGKTTLAHALLDALGPERAVLLAQDSYYRDRAYLPRTAREEVNYDHPDAFDLALLIAHLKALKRGEPILRIVYDYRTHARAPSLGRVEPKEVVLLEGILVLAIPEVRETLDLKVFVDAPPDIRFIRRLQRDIRERGRTVDSVIRQYLATVRPMHEQFVEPSKQYADLVVSGMEPAEEAVRKVLARIPLGVRTDLSSASHGPSEDFGVYKQ
ncbi:MAG TPA: uridine kinase [Candidatus Latescibacteria bacterium]|nr:uridine kinase [Candidatus Latescibacterota bacterium]